MAPSPLWPVEFVFALAWSAGAASLSLMGRGEVGAIDYINLMSSDHQIPIGLVVRIRGFHPRGPGSIPGLGEFFLTGFAEFTDYEGLRGSLKTGRVLFCQVVIKPCGLFTFFHGEVRYGFVSFWTLRSLHQIRCRGFNLSSVYI